MFCGHSSPVVCCQSATTSVTANKLKYVLGSFHCPSAGFRVRLLRGCIFLRPMQTSKIAGSLTLWKTPLERRSMSLMAWAENELGRFLASSPNRRATST